jgi:methionyl-tRNA synthetase
MLPALLIKLKLALPERIIVHGHWVKNNRKMSKSEGNVEDCYWQGIDVDCVRLYFLTEGP